MLVIGQGYIIQEVNVGKTDQLKWGNVIKVGVEELVLQSFLRAFVSIGQIDV